MVYLMPSRLFDIHTSDAIQQLHSVSLLDTSKQQVLDDVPGCQWCVCAVCVCDRWIQYEPQRQIDNVSQNYWTGLDWTGLPSRFGVGVESRF